MVLDNAGNFARSGVSSSIASGDTTIAVVNASVFPDPSTAHFNAIVWDESAGRPDQDSDVEVVRVTGRDTTNDDLTVTRAQEGTTAVSHPSTSAVQVSPTAKMITDIDTSLEDIADYSASPTEVTAGVNTTEASSFGSVDADRIGTDSRYADAVVWTDGSTYYADGKNGKITSGSDASAVIQAAIDSLPPSGTGDSDIESQGTVVIKQGDFDCSSAITLKKGLTLKGIGWDHVPNTSADAATRPATRLNFSASHGFVPPDVDTDLIPSIRVEDMAVDGPGRTSSFDCFACGVNSNIWDLIRINNVNPRDWRRGFDARAGEVDSVWIKDSHFIRMGYEAIWSVTGETFISGCFVYGTGSEGGASGITTGGLIHQTQVQSVGSGHPAIDGQSGSGYAIGCWVGPAGNHGRCFNNINAIGGGVLPNTSCDKQIEVGSDGTKFAFLDLNGTAATVDINHNGGADAQFWGLDPGLSVSSSGTRPRWNGRIGDGPFKGVDLSTTTGQFYGDLARANGSSTAGKGAPAWWDGDNSRWVHSDSQNTVTP